MSEQSDINTGAVSRRNFLKASGLVGVGAIFGGVVANQFIVKDDAFSIEPSQGYLLVDTKKCSGCTSCMIACSLAHEGMVNLGLSRIQVRTNSFKPYPYDIAQNQCRQCPYPACAAACPVGAISADEETGARIVAEDKCIGCQRCIVACPFSPSRMQWNFIDQHAQKCDLCTDTPYWNGEGGLEGERACQVACPMQAISFTMAIPQQTDDGYDVNLRNIHYLRQGYPIDDAGMQPADFLLSKQSPE
jgi:protein NrfC